MPYKTTGKSPNRVPLFGRVKPHTKSVLDQIAKDYNLKSWKGNPNIGRILDLLVDNEMIHEKEEQ